MRTPCDAHHLQVKSERGMGKRASDKWAVPLTRDEHMELHTIGSKRELEWFQSKGLSDPYGLAEGLWALTGNLYEMDRLIWNELWHI